MDAIKMTPANIEAVGKLTQFAERVQLEPTVLVSMMRQCGFTTDRKERPLEITSVDMVVNGQPRLKVSYTYNDSHQEEVASATFWLSCDNGKYEGDIS